MRHLSADDVSLLDNVIVLVLIDINVQVQRYSQDGAKHRTAVHGVVYSTQQCNHMFNFQGMAGSLMMSLLWPPYVIRQAIIFLSCGFFYLSLFFVLFFLA